jgi:hypothetical protein
MENNRNTVEEALLQIRNLEEALQENVKGVLRSTMKEEIKELVKESLNEQDEVEDEEEDVDIEDAGAEGEFEMDDEEMDMDDEEMDMDDEEMDMDDEDEFEMDDEEMDMDDETVDLTGASDEEVLKVFKAMGDEDGIIVKKEDDMIHLEDGEDEYLIQLGESAEFDYMSEEDGDDLNADDFNFGGEMEEGETIYELEVDVPEMEEGMDMYTDSMEEGMDMYTDSMEEGDNFDYMEEEDNIDYMEEEDNIDYMEEGDYYTEEDSLENQIMEALKSKMKPKGIGMGNPSKFKYDKKPNMDGGFNEKRKEAFGKGVKAMGTGKAKFEYKEEKNYGSNKHEFKRKTVDGVKKKAGEKDGHYKTYEKEETKEAARTNSYARANKVGNRKGFDQNINRKEIRQRPNTRVNEEVDMLREKNEEYKKALDIFRTKLNEVAVFNSNLAYATRLFTEHSTTKQEKINILRRFDDVESLKESKNLYRSIKNELTNTTSNEKTITESIEKTVKTPTSGSAANLIESKTYENPQFLRMKDLMSKIN